MKRSMHRINRLMVPRLNIYTFMIFAMILALAYYNKWAALCAIAVYTILFVVNRRQLNAKSKEMLQYIENLTFHVDSATKDTLLKFPLPMVVLTLDGVITWYNPPFGKIFEEVEIFEKKIQDLVDQLDLHPFLAGGEVSMEEIDVNGCYYRVFGNVVSPGTESQIPMVVLYWLDQTELTLLKQQLESGKNVTAMMVIDNYDELIQEAEQSNRPHLLAEIDRRVAQWVGTVDGILRKYDHDKYLVILDYSGLQTLKEKKFEILDHIKSITVENKIFATLSCGIGVDGKSPADNLQIARAAMDIALGRGGDQVVIQSGDKLSFYGGRSQETEKRTKVKPRVVAYALLQLIHQAEKVVIMGHQWMDMDAIGSAVGLCAGVKAEEKEVYVVLHTYNPSSQSLLKKIADSNIYDDVFIPKQEALNMVDEHTLLVIVDTHRAGYTDVPELLTKTNQIVLIDHHRRSAEFIQQAVLTFHEPFASSASEMVAEMLQYFPDKLRLSALEAEALYTGMMMDTKNFVLKTGVRTFEAAAFLRRLGADPKHAKLHMQNDWDTFHIKAETMNQTMLLHEQVAVAVCPVEVDNARVVIAQVADELLNIAGVLASFVLCQNGNQVLVSARSLGEWNVQVILEKMGGGGHMTVAGVQLENTTVDEVVEVLKEEISQYIDENRKGK